VIDNPAAQRETRAMKSFLNARSINVTCALLSLTIVLFIVSSASAQDRTNDPKLLKYPDLVALYENDEPSQDLQQRLTELLSAPFVDNSINAQGLRRTGSVTNSLRVATWNIERGLEFEAVKAALTNDQRFFRRLTPATRSSNFDLNAVLDQARRLSHADIVVLNEVDRGLKRTNYRNVARDLALATHMNYAYAVEFVEVDPLTLGTETLEGESGSDKGEIVKNFSVDTSRTLGLHGTAILSRFPLKNVRVVRFVNQGHDWYADEKKAVSALEKGKQKGAGIVFSERIVREVRRGGRMMILAEVEEPQIPGGVFTIVATHLEQKTKPGGRLKQLEEVLKRNSSYRASGCGCRRYEYFRDGFDAHVIST